jgi:trk system potassium uptake protein TrkH
MVNFRIIARIFSLSLIAEGLFMLVCAAVSYIYNEHTTSSFLLSAFISVVTGIIVFTPLRKEEKIYGNKEGYILVTGIWIILSLFGTLPYLFSGTIHGFTNAFFESVSGFTTTGATIIKDVESLPHGILFWRSLTQWLGGIGIIFISLSIFPVVKSINIQLAATEFTGQTTDKIHPRTIDAAKRLITIYFLITAAQVLLLLLAKMPLFDAVCHSMSTLSTGGFSTKNAGIAAFNTPYIKVIITIFMFIAGTNMTIIYFGLKGEFRKIAGNHEFIFYTIICIVFTILVSVVLNLNTGFPFGKAITDGAFHVVSIITTTGYYTENYNFWGNFMIMIIFLLMFTGGTYGSTSGGIKIVRLLLITQNTRQELKRIIHPSAFIPVRFDKHVIPQPIIHNLLVFIIIYFLLLCFGTFGVSMMGYDMITSFSTSASMLANIGPGLGTFGPFTDYASMPDAGKWFLSILMFLGRLELMTVMILFTKDFYRH